MKNRYLLPLFFLLFINYISGQEAFSKTYDFSMDSDFGTSIQKWGNDYAIYMGSVCDQNTIICKNIMKVDAKGDVLWKQTLIKQRYLSNVGHSLFALKDNNLLTGYTPEDTSGKQFIELRLINTRGDSIWGVQIKKEEGLVLTCLMVTDQGNIIGGAYSKNRGGGEPIYMYIFKIDVEGKIVWEHKMNPGQYSVIRPVELTALPNEEFLLSSYYHEEQWGGSRLRDQIYHMSKEGRIVWRKHFKNKEDFPRPQVITLKDQKIAATYKWGSEKGTGAVAAPPCVQVVSAEGDSLYEHCFETEIGYVIKDIYEANNGDILGCGKKYTKQTVQGWLFRLSAKCEPIWERNIVYDINPHVRGRFEGELYGITEDDWGYIYATGEVFDTFVDHVPTLQASNTWLLKLTPDGCLLDDCTEDLQYVSEFLTTTKEVDNSKEQKAVVRIYPNPSTDIVNILAPSRYKMASLSVYNMNGEKIEDIKMRSTFEAQIDMEGYTKGTYLLRIIFENGPPYVTKLLKY